MATGAKYSTELTTRRSAARFSGASEADTILAVSSDGESAFRLVAVGVSYSASPTQAGVTVVLKSRLGTAYDVTLHTGTADAQYTVYTPDNDLWLVAGDYIEVTAPAAGGVVTSAIVIIGEDSR